MKYKITKYEFIKALKAFGMVCLYYAGAMAAVKLVAIWCCGGVLV